MDEEMKAPQEEAAPKGAKEKLEAKYLAPEPVAPSGHTVVLELVVSRAIDSKYYLMRVKGSEKAGDYRLVPIEVHGKGVKELTLTKVQFDALEKPADWATSLAAVMPTAEAVAIELWKAGITKPTAVGRGNQHVIQGVVQRAGLALNDIIVVIKP